MRVYIAVIIVFLFVFLIFSKSVKAENIYFNNDLYILKQSKFSEINKGYENYYFLEKESENNWTKTLEILDYPEIKNPIKFAQNADKEIETKSGVILLKFIANKKQNKAVLSFIDIGEANGKPYIEHNIYKYEPYKDKGMVILRFAKRYFSNDKDEIAKIAHEIKNINDDLLEQIVISPTPQITEKEI